MTSFLQRTAEAMGLAYRAETQPAPAPSPGVMPPSRAGGGAVSVREATTLDAVFRAFYVLQTSAEQLTLDCWDGARRLNGAEVPQLLRKPDPDEHLATTMAETVTSLAGQGNAVLRIFRWSDGQPVAVRPLPVLECHAWRDRQGRRKITHAGKDYTVGEDVAHLRLLKFTGQDWGLGPVQAAQLGLRGLLDQQSYADQFFTQSGVPNGTLTSDQPISPTEAKQAKELWRETQRHGDGPAVMGKGLTYNFLHLKPSEVQWLETQRFGVTKVARLWGMTSRQLLAAIDGGTDTYSNHQQDEILYVRYTLMRYLREIEITFDQLLPRTRTVRVNVEGLLRTDTLTRYKAHALAIGRWSTADEIRDIEGQQPLTEAQRAELANTPTTTPAEDGENAQPPAGDTTAQEATA